MIKPGTSAVLPAVFATILGASEPASDAIERGKVKLAAANYSAAAKEFQRALRQAGEDVSLRFAAAANMGAALYYAGDYAAAERAYRKALTFRPRLSRAYQLEAASVLNNLAVLYSRTGRLDDAARLAGDAIEQRSALESSESASLAGFLVTLASIQHDQGEFGIAQSKAEHALSIIERASPDEQRKLLPGVLRQLAVTKLALGGLEGAGELLHRAKEFLESAEAFDAHQLASVYGNIGALRILEGRYEDAASWLERAMDIWRGSPNARTREAAAAMNNLAQVYKLTGRTAAAEPLFRHAIEICSARLGDTHPTCALFIANLADLLWSRGNGNAAIHLAEQAVATLERTVRPGHAELTRLRDQLARMQARKHESWSVAFQDLQRRSK